MIMSTKFKLQNNSPTKQKLLKQSIKYSDDKDTHRATKAKPQTLNPKFWIHKETTDEKNQQIQLLTNKSEDREWEREGGGGAKELQASTGA
jgi:hypothetical protein